MKSVLLAALLSITLLLDVCPAWADAFEDSITAYNRGDYAEAVKLLRESAAQGHTHAQYSLGAMYENGLGVAQDYTEAVK